MTPLFSIITVTYNAAETLPATLASVKEQTCRLFEYIVMDGASTDATTELAARAEIPEARIISEPDNGLYDAMNKAMDIATGDYLIFLNAGDTFHTADTLEIIADKIFTNDYPGIIYGQTQLVDSQRRRIGERHLRAPEHLTYDSFAEGMVVCHQAFIVLRRIASTYNLSYRFSADYEWCIRCLQHSRHNVYIPMTIIDYLHDGMTSRNRRASLKERFRIMSYYYGLLPTISRHFMFVPRFIRQRRIESKALKSMDQDQKTDKISTT